MLSKSDFSLLKGIKAPGAGNWLWSFALLRPVQAGEQPCPLGGKVSRSGRRRRGKSKATKPSKGPSSFHGADWGSISCQLGSRSRGQLAPLRNASLSPASPARKKVRVCPPPPPRESGGDTASRKEGEALSPASEAPRDGRAISGPQSDSLPQSSSNGHPHPNLP